MKGKFSSNPVFSFLLLRLTDLVASASAGEFLTKVCIVKDDGFITLLPPEMQAILAGMEDNNPV